MITCHVRYLIDPYQLPAFEEYARLWIPLVQRLGGQHHGYFLPAEGANNVAYCLFGFPGLAEYEQYRKLAETDPECMAAVAKAVQSKFILSYERTFLRPVLG